MPKKILFYGTDWCGDCSRSKKFLDEKGIPYEYINIDLDKKAALYVEKINNGYRSVPTIVFPNGSILTEPSNPELQNELQGTNLLQERT